MFDFSWSELALIGAVALIAIGPKDLPRAMRTMGVWTRKVRSMAGEFQRSVDDMVRQSELDEMRREVERLRAADVRREVEKAVDPAGEIGAAMTIKEPTPEAIPEATPEPPAPTPGPQP